jgi:hypothetical protein
MNLKFRRESDDIDGWARRLDLTSMVPAIAGTAIETVARFKHGPVARRNNARMAVDGISSATSANKPRMALNYAH